MALRIQGSFVSGADGAVRFSSNGEVNRYDVSQIDFIRFDSNSQSANPPPQRHNAWRFSITDRNSDANRTAAPKGTIPAGTNVVVRMIDNVDSQQARVGQLSGQPGSACDAERRNGLSTRRGRDDGPYGRSNSGQI